MFFSSSLFPKHIHHLFISLVACTRDNETFCDVLHRLQTVLSGFSPELQYSDRCSGDTGGDGRDDESLVRVDSRSVMVHKAGIERTRIRKSDPLGSIKSMCFELMIDQLYSNERDTNTGANQEIGNQ